MIKLHHDETGIDVYFNPSQVGQIFEDPANEKTYVNVNGGGCYVKESVEEVLELLKAKGKGK